MLFPAPTTAAVRADSRLRPEQVSTAFTSADLDADIAARIGRKVSEVETKIYAAVSAQWWEAQPLEARVRRAGIATEVAQLLSLASVYGTAGQLNSAYWERANQYRAEAKELLDALLLEIARTKRAEESGDGDASNGAEYVPPQSRSTRVIVGL